jgi:predicted O-methyltransferase YrrM
MDFLEEKLSAYIESHTADETEALRELNRETHAHVLMPRMLSGHLQGQVLSMFSYMIQPKQVLEIGTYTGYSAICLSSGLKEGGTLHTIDINDELTPMVKKYFAKAGVEEKIKIYSGDALKLIPSINETFDIVFIDADKINYSNYYDLVFDKVRVGGFIIADNVLWSGAVLQNRNEMDNDTKAIDDFSNKVHADTRVLNVLFPIRDGLMVIRKI